MSPLLIILLACIALIAVVVIVLADNASRKKKNAALEEEVAPPAKNENEKTVIVPEAPGVKPIEAPVDLPENPLDVADELPPVAPAAETEENPLDAADELPPVKDPEPEEKAEEAEETPKGDFAPPAPAPAVPNPLADLDAAPAKPQTKVFYCDICGQKLDENKKCTGCGMQY